MAISLKARQAKKFWAWANPDKVRDANRAYRDHNKAKTNAQAAARMKRYRARLAK